MADRALIIAVEDYPDSDALSSLPGTNDDAKAFIKWLVETKRIPRENIIYCAASGVAERTHGNSRKEIRKALQQLVREGMDQTEELFIFFSGHGFSFDDPTRVLPVDVVVGSDFENMNDSGDRCIKLQEIQEKLYHAMGPGHHYYFVDACRNLIRRDQVNVTDLGMVFPPSELGRPTLYSLYSTQQGKTANTKSSFVPVLVKALSGIGRSTRWQGLSLYVTFDLLCAHMARTFQSQKVDAKKEGNGEGLILKLDPIPEYECKVTVSNGQPADDYDLDVVLFQGFKQRYTFKGESFTFKVAPNDYVLQCAHQAQPLSMVTPLTQPIEIFQPSEVVFQKQSQPPIGPLNFALTTDEGSTVSIQLPTLNIKASPGSEIEARRVEGGEVLSSTGTLIQPALPGTYVVKMREHGITVNLATLTVGQEDTEVHYDFTSRQQSPSQDQILARFGGAATDLADFSESLGPMADWDLTLWLTIFGASRIIAEPQQFRKLQHLPLQSFDSLTPNSSPVYVLAGLDDPDLLCEVGLSKSASVRGWKKLQSVPDLKLQELLLPASSGFQFVSLRIRGETPLTMVTHCIPNRVAFFIVTKPREGRLTAHQFLLPIHSLRGSIDPFVWKNIDQNPLSYMRLMYQSLRKFSFRRTIVPSAEKAGIRNADWMGLLYGKWLDPVMGLLGCYDLIRQGAGKHRPLLAEAIFNLRNYFSGIADIECIAKLSGAKDFVRPKTPPLFLDGAFAFIRNASMLRLPCSKLDYTGPWTAWRAAVSATRAK